MFNVPVRMILSDMDGTLLRSDETISEGNVSAIHEAQKRGILFAVCTGRPPEQADAMLTTFGIYCPICGNNGSTIWDANTDTVLFDQRIAPEAAARVCRIAAEAQIDFILFGRKLVVGNHEMACEVGRGRYAGLLEHKYQVRYLYGAEAIQEAIDSNNVSKIYLFGFRPGDARKQRAEKAFRQIPQLDVASSSLANLEISPAGCGKAKGLAEMARLYGVDLRSVMAVGDYENDVPMLTAAGLGIAMGNAAPEVKRRADGVTDDHDADGVAKAIRKYALHQTD